MTKIEKPHKYDCTCQLCAEKRTGLKFGEIFFCNNGITLKADGYEAPYVEINGKPHELEEIKVLYWALFKALKWCKEGFCPGAC